MSNKQSAAPDNVITSELRIFCVPGFHDHAFQIEGICARDCDVLYFQGRSGVIRRSPSRAERSAGNHNSGNQARGDGAKPIHPLSNFFFP